MKPVLTANLISLAMCAPLAAHAQFAEPPPDRAVIVDDDYSHAAPPQADASTLRALVGPALRVDGDAAGGLFAGIDLGSGSAGLRASALWVQAGSEGGLAQYGAELWLDFGRGSRLHPVLGAGAGWARLDLRNDAGELEAASLGVGTLRASLEYVLPIVEADARAGVDLIGNVPAIRTEATQDASAWLTAVARVGVGF
jgi:hypothetical protein